MDVAVRWRMTGDSAAMVSSVTASAPNQVDATRSAIDLDGTPLPVLEPGTPLEPGGVYLDLNRPARGPFRALAGQVAGTGNRYVAKRDVPCSCWYRLVEAAAASSTVTDGVGAVVDGLVPPKLAGSAVTMSTM
jgi:hypothetical protein